ISRTNAASIELDLHGLRKVDGLRAQPNGRPIGLVKYAYLVGLVLPSANLCGPRATFRRPSLRQDHRMFGQSLELKPPKEAIPRPHAPAVELRGGRAADPTVHPVEQVLNFVLVRLVATTSVFY